MGSCRKLCALGVVALVLAGCGSSSSDEQTPAEPKVLPSEQTQAAYEAFLGASDYTKNGWISDVPAPREESSGVSPHDRVRVWFSPKAVESFDAGNGLTSTAPEHFIDTMVVKELYEGDTLVGQASFWKVDAGKAPTAWIYYCRGPAGRCYSNSPALDVTPLYKKGEPQCGSCHGGFVFTTPP
jgi:hypothetical protein